MRSTRFDEPMYVNLPDFYLNTTGLTTEECGAYLLAQMHCWVHGSMPDDPKMLATIMKLGEDDNRVITEALQLFEKVDGRWCDPQLTELKTRVIRRRKMAHEKAQKASATRWKRAKRVKK